MNRIDLRPVILVFALLLMIACGEEQERTPKNGLGQKMYQLNSYAHCDGIGECTHRIETISINGVPVNTASNMSKSWSFSQTLHGMVKPDVNVVTISGDVGKCTSLQVEISIQDAMIDGEMGLSFGYAKTVISGDQLGKPIEITFSKGKEDAVKPEGMENNNYYHADELQDIGTFTEQDKKDIYSKLQEIVSLIQKVHKKKGDYRSEILETYRLPVIITASALHLTIDQALDQYVKIFESPLRGMSNPEKKTIKVLPFDKLRFNVGQRAVLVSGQAGSSPFPPPVIHSLDDPMVSEDYSFQASSYTLFRGKTGWEIFQ